MKRTRPAMIARLSVGVAVVLALAACTSTQDVLEPTALVASDASGASQDQSQFPVTAPAHPLASPQPAAPAQPATAAVSPIATSARVRFAPVVGAPGAASTPLAARLTARAGQRGIGLVGPEDGSASLIMKGYFSAISDGGETTVIYVWDVMDPAGTRVHRIQGQARNPSGSAEGWNGVQPATMESIADQTVDQLAAWLSTARG